MARIDVSTNKFSALVKKEIWREKKTGVVKTLP